jgi:hypothetical protein
MGKYKNSFNSRGGKFHIPGSYSSSSLRMGHSLKMNEFSPVQSGPSEWISPERPKIQINYNNLQNSYFYPKSHNNGRRNSHLLPNHMALNTVPMNQSKNKNAINALNNNLTKNTSPSLLQGNKLSSINLCDLKNILEEEAGAHNSENSMSDSNSEVESEGTPKMEEGISLTNTPNLNYHLLNRDQPNITNFAQTTPNYYLNRKQSISKSYPVTPMFQYTASNFVKNERPPLPQLLHNYTSNSNSTCSSVKEDPNITANSQNSSLFNFLDKRKNSTQLQVNHMNSILGLTFNNMNNIKRKSFAFLENENYRQHFFNGTSGNNSSGKSYTYKNIYNKYNLSQNSENTEILTVKINLEGEKSINVRRFDDLVISTKNFCDKNKLSENFVKPIVNKISESLGHIYKIYNSDVNGNDAEYLNSLNILCNNSKGNFQKYQPEEETKDETSFEKDITSISSITINENDMMDGDQEVLYGGNLFNINNSF